MQYSRKHENRLLLVLIQVKHDGPVSGADSGRDETRVLSWSNDATVRLSDIGADYQWPRESLLLRVEALTGTRLDLQLGKLRALSRDEWLERKKRYEEIGSRRSADADIGP